MGCTSTKSPSVQSVKQVSNMSTQTDNDSCYDTQITPTLKNSHPSKKNRHVLSNPIKNEILDQNDEFVKDICFPMHRYINNQDMSINNLIIDIKKINISRKIRYGTVSRIYYGKLTENNAVIDIILKGIYKVDIVRHHMYQYILRELLIGLSLCKYTEFVKYIGMTYDDNQIYLILEQFGDNNLSEYLSISKLQINDKIYICKIILNIIAKLHELNIVHRDIKLSNFVIKNEQIKLCDMGTAVINTQIMNSFCGTLTHMSPFIKNGQGYDANIDWWSYGVTILEIFFNLDNIDIIMCTIVDNPNQIRKILYNQFNSGDYINESLIDLLHYIFSCHLSQKTISETVLLNHIWFNQISIKIDSVNESEIPSPHDLSLSPFNIFMEKCSRLSFVDDINELIITDNDTNQKYNPLQIDVANIVESIVDVKS